jgi:zinc transporter ZupT
MLAASYWSLLAPAIEIAEESELYGPNGRWAFIPAATGFAMGAGAMLFTEKVLPLLGTWTQRPQSWEKKFDDPPNNYASPSNSGRGGYHDNTISSGLRGRKSGMSSLSCYNKICFSHIIFG